MHHANSKKKKFFFEKYRIHRNPCKSLIFPLWNFVDLQIISPSAECKGELVKNDVDSHESQYVDKWYGELYARVSDVATEDTRNSGGTDAKEEDGALQGVHTTNAGAQE